MVACVPSHVGSRQKTKMAQRAEGEFWDKERIKKRGEEGRGQFGVVSMYTIHCLHVKKKQTKL